MFSSQWNHVFWWNSGMIAKSPSFTAFTLFSASSLQFIHHCGLRNGSTMSLDLEQRPRRIACDFFCTHKPFCLSASSTALRPSKRCWPAKGPPLPLIEPSSLNTEIISRPLRWPHLKSLTSCAGVIFTQPVPNSRSTMVSATTTIFRSGKKGCSSSFPTKALYRSSSGCTATATSPSIVSRRVVATMRCSFEPLMGYLNSHSTPTSTLPS
mmetsp:Transcript_73268/g.212213  ORF Transcript_73268/g.212213 Transcript_73268/m.212213 type:complete len:210 (+) Transcript_73268:704-1333(+)